MTAKGRAAACGRSNAAGEWNTTTSRTSAASNSVMRRRTDCRCRLHTGQSVRQGVNGGEMTFGRDLGVSTLVSDDQRGASKPRMRVGMRKTSSA